MVLNCIKLAIKIASGSVPEMGDTRKLFLTALFTLIEKSADVDLLLQIVKVDSSSPAQLEARGSSPFEARGPQPAARGSSPASHQRTRLL